MRRQKYTSTDVHIKEYLVESVVGDIKVAVSEDESGNESCVDSVTTDTSGNDLTLILEVVNLSPGEYESRADSEVFDTDIKREYESQADSEVMQDESRADSDDFAIADLLEIIEGKKEYLPTVVTTGRLLSNVSVDNDVFKNNDPIKNEILDIDLLLKSISREIKLFDEMYGKFDTLSTVFLKGVNKDAGHTEKTPQMILQ